MEGGGEGVEIGKGGEGVEGKRGEEGGEAEIVRARAEEAERRALGDAARIEEARLRAQEAATRLAATSDAGVIGRFLRRSHRR